MNELMILGVEAAVAAALPRPRPLPPRDPRVLVEAEEEAARPPLPPRPRVETFEVVGFESSSSMSLSGSLKINQLHQDFDSAEILDLH